jgi:hypothetical protein
MMSRMYEYWMSERIYLLVHHNFHKYVKYFRFGWRKNFKNLNNRLRINGPSDELQYPTYGDDEQTLMSGFVVAGISFKGANWVYRQTK